MPKIQDLVPDIYAVLSGTQSPDGKGNPSIWDSYERQLEGRRPPTVEDPLYATDIGTNCARKLWYKRNKPGEAEPLPPYTKFKFMYGDTIEELLLALAKDAGHEVRLMQESVRLEHDGRQLVRGRIDAIIDNHVVDVKSMSSPSFKKYNNEGLHEGNDLFGYRWQLALYHHMLADRGEVDADAPAFLLGADKQLGHISLIPCNDLPSRQQVIHKTAGLMKIVKDKEPPARGFAPAPMGARGNMILGTACSYCDFKRECWPGLRTFLYARGPTHFTTVVETPNVQEAHHLNRTPT